MCMAEQKFQARQKGSVDRTRGIHSGADASAIWNGPFGGQARMPQFSQPHFAGNSREVIQMQRESPESQRRRGMVQDFFWRLKQDDSPDKRLNVYSFIISDGLGDAGQLKILYDKVKSREDELGVLGKIRMLCVFSIKDQLLDQKGFKEIDLIMSGNWRSNEMYRQADSLVRDRTEEIQRTCGVGNDGIKYVADSPYAGENFRGNAFDVQQNDWEIEYPVPDRIFTTPKEEQTLKIKEMGQESDIPNTVKAGDVTQDGIGYGIKDTLSGLTGENPHFAEDFLRSKGVAADKIDELLHNAWIVSVKNYIYDGKDTKLKKAGFPMEKALEIARLAKENGAKLIIFAGMLPQFELSLWDRIRLRDMIIICEKISHDTLLDFMEKIVGGVIISGGEGLFAESLATQPDKDTASVLAGRYAFQYYEVANALANMEPLESISPSEKDPNLKLSQAERFRIFKYGFQNGLYFYCDKGGFREILNGNMDGEALPLNFFLSFYNKEQSEAQRTFYYSHSLSALYLPLIINGKVPMKMPEVFGGDLGAVLAVFKRLKGSLVSESWLKLIDNAIAQPAGQQE